MGLREEVLGLVMVIIVRVSRGLLGLGLVLGLELGTTCSCNPAFPQNSSSPFLNDDSALSKAGPTGRCLHFIAKRCALPLTWGMR